MRVAARIGVARPPTEVSPSAGGWVQTRSGVVDRSVDGWVWTQRFVFLALTISMSVAVLLVLSTLSAGSSPVGVVALGCGVVSCGLMMVVGVFGGARR